MAYPTVSKLSVHLDSKARHLVTFIVLNNSHEYRVIDSFRILFAKCDFLKPGYLYSDISRIKHPVEVILLEEILARIPFCIK